MEILMTTPPPLQTLGLEAVAIHWQQCRVLQRQPAHRQMSRKASSRQESMTGHTFRIIGMRGQRPWPCRIRQPSPIQSRILARQIIEAPTTSRPNSSSWTRRTSRRTWWMMLWHDSLAQLVSSLWIRWYLLSRPKTSILSHRNQAGPPHQAR